MYLHRIFAQNFRTFGGTSSSTLDWELNPGMNILIGENDAGKTSIIDAIRQILWTTSFESLRLFEHDFHTDKTGRAQTLIIQATLKGLSPEQEAAVLEWLTYETDGTCSLILNLQGKLHPPQSKRRGRVETIVRTGLNGSGPEIGSAVRELVRATYLKPLRDAEAELKSSRQSRLSQILAAHTLMAGQDVSDFDSNTPAAVPKSLVGLMEHAQHHIGDHDVVKAVQKDINENYLKHMSFVGDDLSAEIRVAGSLNLSGILEKFELALLPPNLLKATDRYTRGLGYNNALFMATELVLLRDGDELGLLLVEEPEAHMHPQLQSRVMDLLEQHASNIQVVMTTHSPSLAASSAIENMILVHKGKTYPLRPEETRLAKSDYQFLRKFIDATKSNLFFARGVAIVEGTAEALLLPAIAEMADLSFSKYGISVVNVGNVGLYHYARILQRKVTDQCIAIPVACITDRDIVPNDATYVSQPKKGKRFERDYTSEEAIAACQRKINRVEVSDNPNVKVFVSNYWTLEYDLAKSDLVEVIYYGIQLAVVAKDKDERLSDEDEEQALTAAKASWPTFRAGFTTTEALAIAVYQPLYEKEASKAISAEYIAKLLYTGTYGKGASFLHKLPDYLKNTLSHLTGTTLPVVDTAEVVE
jgi:putative ATP-dependent endonuclease of OLD family